MPNKIDLTGRTYGRLTVIKDHPKKSNGVHWECLCSCGNSTVVHGNNLRRGLQESCGCLRRDVHTGKNNKNFKHGGYRSRTFKIWQGMLNRCFNINSRAYPSYGGRGITVCNRWLDFSQFKSDMGEAPEGLSIERLDNEMSYCKDNCVWADRKAQALNTRKALRALTITVEGSPMFLRDAAPLLGLSRSALQHRVTRGWTLERIVGQKQRKRKDNG